MPPPLRAVVVGLGHIGHQHLAALQATDAAHVVGICDLSQTTCRAVGERFGLTTWNTDLSELLELTRPDLVHVATTPGSHVPIAELCLEAGIGVLVEKPFSNRLGQADALCDLAAQKSLVLMENYNYVFNRQLRQIRGAWGEENIGEILHVDITCALDVLAEGNPFSKPGSEHFALDLPAGIIGDFLPHLASLAYFLLGPHTSAVTRWAKREESCLPADELTALVDFTGGGTAQLAFRSHARPDGFLLDVQGTKGRVSVDLFGTLLAVQRQRSLPSPLVPVANGLTFGWDNLKGGVTGLVRKLSGGPGGYEGLHYLVQHTYRSLQAGDPPPITGDDVRAVNSLVDDLSTVRLPA